jgi:copper(I)-binding protein
MGMETVPALEVLPGASRTLAPGGDHLMLMGLKSHPAENTEIEITLHFEPGDRKIVVKAPVLREAPKE